MLDALISDTISRFGKQHETAVGLSLLIPKQVVQCDDFKPLEDSTRFFAKIISDFNINVTLKLLKAEISKWRIRWQQCKVTPPTTAIDIYSNCDVRFYPFIKQLLQVQCTLPVSVAAAERSFSKLTWLKVTLSTDSQNHTPLDWTLLYNNAWQCSAFMPHNRVVYFGYLHCANYSYRI